MVKVEIGHFSGGRIQLCYGSVDHFPDETPFHEGRDQDQDGGVENHLVSGLDNSLIPFLQR